MKARDKTGAVDYVPELDSLRTVAILSVMCIHWLPRENLINRLQHDTGWGVYLFFALSGFLITRILMRCRETIENGAVTHRHSLRQFYVRRFLRIFPIYYLLLFVGAALNVEGVRDSFPWHATYLSNVYFFHRGSFVGPTTPFWSLAVEEQFYLLWPFVILFLPIKKIMPFVAMMAVLGIICKSAALVSHRGIYFILTPACVHYLAIGALVAVCENSLCGSIVARSRLMRIYLLLIALFSIGAIAVKLAAPNRHGVQEIMTHGAAAFLFGWIVARTSQGVGGTLGMLMRFPPIVYLGKISYGLYCYHSFVKWSLLWCIPYLSKSLGEAGANFWMTNFGVRFLVTAIVASASWFAFEKPLNDLKRFFPYTRKARPLPLEERGIPVPEMVSHPPSV